MKLLLIIATVAVFGVAASSVTVQKLSPTQKTSIKPAKQTEVLELTEAQAIEFAEKFIHRNGYTDLPPDKENLVPESIEWESNVDEMLKMRHNTLEHKAFGVLHGKKRNEDGWTVIFKYKSSPSKNGRAVTMNSDGSKARVEHQDFILAKVETKL